jgi:hypothetical protein
MRKKTVIIMDIIGMLMIVFFLVLCRILYIIPRTHFDASYIILANFVFSLTIISFIGNLFYILLGKSKKTGMLIINQISLILIALSVYVVFLFLNKMLGIEHIIQATAITAGIPGIIALISMAFNIEYVANFPPKKKR